MKISIITVAYNSAETITDTLLSVSQQSHSNVEHLIIDGGSTDGTLSIVEKRCNERMRLVSEPDCGVYDAMNKGLALASGDVVGTLNADDLYADASVLQQVSSVFQDPMVDACYADLVYVDRATATDVVRYWKSCPFRPGLFSKGWCPPHPTFFVRKSIYEKLGCFNLSYKLAADAELMMRFIEVSKIYTIYVPCVWVRMRLGGATNKSIGNIVQQNLEIARAARANNISFNVFTASGRKLVSRLWQFYAKPA